MPQGQSQLHQDKAMVYETTENGLSKPHLYFLSSLILIFFSLLVTWIEKRFKITPFS